MQAKPELPVLKKQATSVSSTSIDSQQQETILKLMDDIKAEKKKRAKLESDHQGNTAEAKEKIHHMQRAIEELEAESERLR